MTEKITAWSFSRYNLYQQCPGKAKLMYIDKLKEPTSDAMLNCVVTSLVDETKPGFPWGCCTMGKASTSEIYTPRNVSAFPSLTFSINSFRLGIASVWAWTCVGIASAQKTMHNNALANSRSLNCVN